MCERGDGRELQHLPARPLDIAGTSRVGEDTIHWGPKDIFSLPHGNWITHKADETATLFLVTDRDALSRLDLLKEQFGNEF